MSIPESQLDTWAHQGSITQSSNTYNAIKTTLESSRTPYAGKNYRVFLQGSYGNDTNIYAESDVDVVIQLDDVFYHDLESLTESQRTAFHAAHPNATYTYANFKSDVLGVLQAAYGSDVKSGKKAIQIAAGGSRRKADVIVATQFRRYHKFGGGLGDDFVEGICFYDDAGQRIANYPSQHSKNMTTKHQSSALWLKPMVRVLKNLRGRLVADGRIAPGTAPSYYLEGLLYNVPPDRFGSSYVDCFVNCVNWIQKADKSKFVCANEQYYLLREVSPVTWRAPECEHFLAAAVKLWNEW